MTSATIECNEHRVGPGVNSTVWQWSIRHRLAMIAAPLLILAAAIFLPSWQGAERRLDVEGRRLPLVDPEHPCGAIALFALAHATGVDLDLGNIARALPVDSRGKTMLGEMMATARDLGMECTAMRSSSGSAFGIKAPFIALVDDGHYLLVGNGPEGGLLIVDPPHRAAPITPDELKRRWRGFAIFRSVDLPPQAVASGPALHP